MAPFLIGRKDLLSRPLEVGDTRPLDLKKQKTWEGPSNEVRQKEKEAEGTEVDEDLDTSLGNLLRQALEREKKLKEEVKRANEQEKEIIAKLKQGNQKEPKESARLMEENKHLQVQIQSANQQMKEEQVDMQRALEEAMKTNADLRREKNQLEADYKEEQDQFGMLVGQLNKKK